MLVKEINDFEVVLLRFRPEQPVFNLDVETNKLSVNEIHHRYDFGFMTDHKIEWLLKKQWGFYGNQTNPVITKNNNEEKILPKVKVSNKDKTKEVNKKCSYLNYPKGRKRWIGNVGGNAIKLRIDRLFAEKAV